MGGCLIIIGLFAAKWSCILPDRANVTLVNPVTMVSLHGQPFLFFKGAGGPVMTCKSLLQLFPKSLSNFFNKTLRWIIQMLSNTPYIRSSNHTLDIVIFFPQIYMGGNLLTVQSLILMSYFLYFWAPFLATYRFAQPKLAIFSENVWVPHGLHVSVWTIQTFYIALFSEKCNRT